jgi:hypothetical protein
VVQVNVNLTWIHLYLNDIKDVGAKAFAECLKV